DYYTPQLYWKVKSDQAYPALLNWWTHKDQNPKGRHLWPGNFTGRTNPKDGNWPASEVVEQIEVTRKNPKSTGNVHFSMKAFTNNFSGISTALKSGPYARPALIPPSPWLDDRAPDAPVLVSSARRNGVWRVTVKPGSAEAIRFYVFMAKRGGNWSVAKVSSEPTADLPGDATGAAVYALDRVSNASEALMVSGR
ncbi:MAG TPA: hypothetical protein VEX38_08765, partial [Fimbriimonadaceae bacterium]|nr:hypothetical protein [Fimbriimonadaceae bacterium]